MNDSLPRELMKARLIRVMPYVLLLVATIYFYYLSTNIQFPAHGGRIGPDFWPKIILLLLGATCAYEIVKNLLVAKPHDVKGVLQTLTAASGEEDASAEGQSYLTLLAAGIGLTILYVSTIGYLGFFLATAPYMALFMYIGRYRRIGVIAAASLSGTLVLMFVFMRIVYVSLPIGVGPFAKVSTVLMTLMGVK
jgi:putative tricarboxylic transport membrane protein